MKRLCILLLVVVLVLCIGCAKQWSDETGHIYRYDIEPGDLVFLFDEWEYEPDMTEKELAQGLLNAFRKDTIKPNDIFDALGLPYITGEAKGVISYLFLFGDEDDHVWIRYNTKKEEVEFSPSIRSAEYIKEARDMYILWSAGDHGIDRERYKMRKRYDIRERELSFIDENTTSKEVQSALGAPHFYVESKKVGDKSVARNAFAYELKNDKVFKIIYFRQGYILRAWIEDDDGNEIDILIDRDIKIYYKE